jgi:putative zinc finger/helix-turn-helix YgiT family protein
MLEYCLNCDYEEALELIREPVVITVRGEAISVTEEFYKCPACGEKFTSSLGHDALDEAYREYRHRHSFVQPEGIRQWRKHYGLTQTELSHLLEWDEATLNRCEQGALQEKSEDKWLQFIMAPQNLLYLIISKPEILTIEKREQLIAKLSSNQIVVQCLEQLYTLFWKNYQPNLCTGLPPISLVQRITWINELKTSIFHKF